MEGAAPSTSNNDVELQHAIEMSLSSNKEQLKHHKECRRKIRRQLPQNHQIISILADGRNCLFRAISKGLSVHHQNWTHIELRSKCVDVISTCSMFTDRFFDQRDFNNCTTKMRHDGEYGDELCIQALSYELNFSVKVFSPDQPIQTFGDPTLDS